MKLHWLALTLVSLPLFVLTVPFLASRSTPVVAVEKKATARPTAVPSPTPTPTRSEYVLPYPGILPDHPLFVVKRFRDWIIELLITDPVRKAEFYILQADKRLNMGVFLKNQGKEGLTPKVFSEAETFRRQALAELNKVSQGGREIPAYVVERLEQSLVKHIEALSDLGLTEAAAQISTLVREVTSLKVTK